MKKLFTLIIICIAVNAKADSWTQKASFGGGSWFSFSFSIGNKGYVGCGIDSSSAGFGNNSFWEYDPSINAWTQKANFGGLARADAIGFAIGNKGYAGLGDDRAYNYFQDFWEYDVVNNVWTQKANFGGGIRGSAVGFSINNMGYIGTGRDSIGTNFNDLWQYNPLNNTWSPKSNLPASGRQGASCFTIGNYGYILAGCVYFALSGSLTDLWEYNTITDTWLQKSNFPSVPRFFATSFSICNKGYFGCGANSDVDFFNDLWEYNQATNGWIQKTNFPSLSRAATPSFVMGTNGYIGLGYSNSFVSFSFYNDFYEYTPDSACTTGIDELTFSDFTIYPNPPKGEFTISGLQSNKNVEIKIFDTKGKTVLSKHYQTSTSQLQLPTANLSTGIYFVQVSDAENKVVRKMVVE